MGESLDDSYKEVPTSLRDTENYVDSYKDNEIDESDRLSFAKQILFYLFLVVIFVFSCSYIIALNFSHENEELNSVVNTILDITKTAVPSIVTLVLGFYFGRKE